MSHECNYPCCGDGSIYEISLPATGEKKDGQGLWNLVLYKGSICRLFETDFDLYSHLYLSRQSWYPAKLSFQQRLGLIEVTVKPPTMPCKFHFHQKQYILQLLQFPFSYDNRPFTTAYRCEAR